MAMTEDLLVHDGLWEIKVELQKKNEEIATILGKWEEPTVQLQGFDSEIGNVRAQL